MVKMERSKLNLTETNNYAELNQLFIKNELEVSDENPVTTDIVKAWRLADDGKLIGGIMLAKRQGEFIIDGVAVEPEYRELKLGKWLLDTAIAEARARSGNRMYLVARAPGFFRTQGFLTVPKEEAPLFFECLTCPQYGESCHPEVMKLEI